MRCSSPSRAFRSPDAISGAALALSVVLFANLIYSLQYLTVVTNQTPGVDSANLWGPLTSFYALIAVGTFFATRLCLSRHPRRKQRLHPKPRLTASEADQPREAWPVDAGATYDPREGLSVMSAVDYVVMSVLGLGSFLLSFIRLLVSRR